MRKNHITSTLLLQSSKTQAHKPNSVSTLSFIWFRYHYRNLSIYPPTLGEPPYMIVGLHDVSAFEVYLEECITANLYFHSRKNRDNFLWHFLSF